MCALNDVDAEEFRPFDGESGFERTLQMMKEGIRLANAMGVKSVMYWEGVRPRGSKSDEDLEKTIIDLYRRATEFSAKFGIRLLVEPHPFSLGMNLHYLSNLADSQDERYFGILFDTCHFGVGKPEEYIEAIRFLGKRRIKYIHFSDSDLKTSELHYPPGKGRLDLEGIVEAFREIDYDGEISLDTWGYPLPEEAAKVGIPYLKQVLKKLGLD
jgi:sugar phosphate isomerase/epimerase